ncbi:MAG: hypothetical protein SGJ19_29195 [Planctomycetia bacterium]|nr:hypothetical protein [Planctomycetia bacterium]
MRLLDLLMVLLLSAHLMAMNVATAGPFVCLWLGWRTRRTGDALASTTGEWLARMSLIGLTSGIVLGGLVLGAIYHHRPEPFLRAAELIPRSRYWFGIAELVFSYLLLVVYLATWRRFAGRWWHALINLLAATNTIYHFPPLFAGIGVLTTRPETWGKPELGRQELLKLFAEPETLARASHFVLASFAVTGVMLLGLAMRRARDESQRDDAARIGVWGGWLGLVPTALQLMSGLWLLMISPTPFQAALTGGDTWSTVLFGVSLLAAFAMLPPLAAAAFGAARRRDYLRAMILLTTVIVCMVAARHLAQQRMYDRFAAPKASAMRSNLGSVRPGDVPQILR